jgi:hypothetical protein
VILKNEIFVYLIDWLITAIGLVSILIISVMPLYLVKKHESISALAFWEYANKKEYIIIKFGYMGLLLSFVLIILSAYLNN